MISKNGRDYPQAYYHYEFWSQGDRLIKSSKYIPKRLLNRVQQMERKKAAVKEILQVLGVKNDNSEAVSPTAVEISGLIEPEHASVGYGMMAT
ncbi:hypothetical protein H6G96_21860 [Nostoc sp. FACHB-892]|uniref:hypothetical protein n=1 Tax=Nostoc sp. FACHB-892 TaxID=2692843 RepID=UPI00168A321A|nr:hypothetical protein [Nostoc sp. FACHB-892]MBD2728894.1 hypothetical protein [Nostoc sp. FACHB-892]